ncbi:twin-arginine translocation signal domain-containing protein [Sulfurimonas gotlandica]|jgi:hypothetical protein|uniref:twin-arginine translocation signal domain-containing protein n=1 Tax=Sulfurimonas gotlandica TaxID=1176482 RepID=UPI000183AF7D|nr:twin-arginine translocation signal domain-containing protein [Sulfurimonas gotlandica]EDZ63841.1 Tat pathway signal sequence domain protein [Sulfurimonas gotlandica GD1]
MQESRRNFLKNSALVVGTAAVGATALAANKEEVSLEANSHGVVVGSSTKKEILYKKTQAWEDFYKQAL